MLTNYVTFRCPDEWRDALEKIAADNDRKLSAELRRAVRLYLKTHGIDTT